MTGAKPLMWATLASVLLSQPAWADHRKDDRKHGDKYTRHADHAACWFQPHDVQVITEYYAPQHRSLPPGLAKKYYRTGQLPPGWQKKIQPMPAVVERQLIALPPEYRRGVIDGYAIVYNPRTQVMIDVVAVFGH
jgi:hypothetical protein